MKPPNNRLNPAPLIEDAVQMAARLADEQGALNRLQEYADGQGLEETTQNVEAVQKWLDENLRGHWSSKGVDLAVSCLGPRGSNVLTWKQAAAARSPASQPSEVLGKLPNGENQLPLDASEQVMRAASVVQLRELSKRRGEGQSRPGFFSSKL